jgi:hypothetical protein
MFCATGLVSGGTAGVRYRFQVLRSRTRFWRYRGRRVPFSSFALPDSFSTVPKASGFVFMFCAPGLFLSGTEGAESRFHVLHSRTRFGRYLGRQVPFSSFALLDIIFPVPRASGLVLKFCAPRQVFGGNEGVGYRFQVLRSRTHFRRYRGFGYRFRVLRSRTLFGRYRGCQGSFSSFALPDTFLAVPRVSGAVFMFCAPDTFWALPRTLGLVFMFCAP